ncbi:hypothetical protein AAFC00_007203 [Neodothiora populina]|uniref:Pirin n=1 Tax=Neodothiora populina TaxID=2781224 RepID=A0ABR3PHQ9_9PEZI
MSSAPQSTFAGLPVIPPEDPSLNAKDPKTRGIQQFFEAVDTPEGAGARVRRSIGTRQLKNFTPFLMLDHFSVSPGAGFPDHPHRGQETVTYLMHGTTDHEDFAGNKGTLYDGDLQFMTAGRGIMHSEMPRANPDGSPNVGMQLWVDLPKSLKNCEPRYRDVRAKEIPTAKTADGKVTIKVISGQSEGVDSLQELAYTPIWLLDITIQPGGKIVQRLPSGWNAFGYNFEGNVIYGEGADEENLPRYHIAVFEQSGDQIIARVPENAENASRLVLLAGLPLDQKIVQYGPFVCTSTEEVYKALLDYQTFSNGFERAQNWESEIGKPMMA